MVTTTKATSTKVGVQLNRTASTHCNGPGTSPAQHQELVQRPTIPQAKVLMVMYHAYRVKHGRAGSNQNGFSGDGTCGSVCLGLW